MKGNACETTKTSAVAWAQNVQTGLGHLGANIFRLNDLPGLVELQVAPAPAPEQGFQNYQLNSGSGAGYFPFMAPFRIIFRNGADPIRN